MCLGGLFVPEAYITATRQYVAQANSWSLEELCLEVNVTTSQSATLDACSFGVTGELGSSATLGFSLWQPVPAPGPPHRWSWWLAAFQGCSQSDVSEGGRQHARAVHCVTGSHTAVTTGDGA